MIQRFIELGEGYTDLYELIEIGKSNRHRVARLLSLHTTINEKELTSPVVVLDPTSPGDFQPLYISREGIPDPRSTPSRRFELFEELARDLGKPIIQLDVKSSVSFKEKQLYYQYLIGILRMNRYLAPLK